MANAPWCTTGYGVQGKHLAPRLQALGHEMAYFAFHGLQNGVLNFQGVPIFPQGNLMWGEDILPAHMQSFQGDLLITLIDVWVSDAWGRLAAAGGWRWWPWTPIDQEPVPDVVLQRLSGADLVLPYSQWGAAMLREAGVNNVRYVPHAVATGTFKPVREEIKRAVRRAAGVPEDAFVIGMVAANKGFPPRKCFPEQLIAFKQFQAYHPEAVFFLHTLKTPLQDGVNFKALLARLGLVEGRDVFFTDQYDLTLGLPESAMAMMYGMFDVLSAASSSEGFGIPIIEAQACGVPVVTTGTTAMPELTGAGLVVTQMHPYWTQMDAWTYLPHPEAIADAYEEIWDWRQSEKRWGQVREQARTFALTYDWDAVVERYWAPLLAQAEG